MDLVLNSDRPGDEGCTDFTLHPEATSCWITVGNISVYIIRTNEGVAVDLLPKGKEYEEAIGSTWASEVLS